jgi:hypothetical protein
MKKKEVLVINFFYPSNGRLYQIRSSIDKIESIKTHENGVVSATFIPSQGVAQLPLISKMGWPDHPIICFPYFKDVAFKKKKIIFVIIFNFYFILKDI